MADHMVSKLFDRVLKVSPLFQEDLDEATLGKSGHFMTSPRTSPILHRPRVLQPFISASLERPTLNGFVRTQHPSHVVAAARDDKAMQAMPFQEKAASWLLGL